MNSKDVEEVKSLLSLSKEEQPEAIPYDPKIQVEDALASFLQSRLKKLEQDNQFEEQIRRMISTKLPEATFGELMRLLDIFQTNNNMGVEKVLSPFIPRAGERVPLLDEKKKRDTATDEVPKEMNQDLLQAFQELSKMMATLKPHPDGKAEEIKEALKP